MTDRICIASNGADQSHLSAEDVTSCDVLGDMGCNGGIPSTVYSYYRFSGIVTGGNYGDKSGCYSCGLARRSSPAHRDLSRLPSPFESSPFPRPQSLKTHRSTHCSSKG